jgi:deazaflavin-dependent oxidoreductase (nitroreductase family)
MRDEEAQPRPPRGFARLAFRLPIWLYRLHLGWLLGGRFLLLQHTGRKSGRLRETVLEVVRYDPGGQAYYIGAGFGESSDWFQNLRQTPQATIRVARRSYQVIAKRVPLDAAGAEYRIYASQHPSALKGLSSFLGVKLTGTEEDYPMLAHRMPLIRLQVVSQPSEIPANNPAV